MTDHDMRHDPSRPPADDEPLDGWLAELAADYHRPPATPRDEMWARIQAARGRDAAPAPVEAAVPALTVISSDDVAGDDLARRRAGRGAGSERRWLRPLVALAATLLLGVAIGRWSSLRPEAARTDVAAALGPNALPGAAPVGTLGPAVVMPEPVAPGSVVPDGVVPDGPERRAGRGAASPARPADAAPERVYAAVTPADRAADSTAAADAASAMSGTTYRVATLQHLGQAEALLTAFRAEPPREEGVPSLEPWARDLLTTTRLLLDSPAAADSRLGPLLGDLETVLVQIVQLPAARAAEERQIIAQSLDRGDLLTQLRSAVPAGPAAPQRSGE